MDRDAATRVGRAPLIFCRNLFIYFSESAIRQVVETLADVMPTPGYLSWRRPSRCCVSPTDLSSRKLGDRLCT